MCMYTHILLLFNLSVFQHEEQLTSGESTE